MTINSTTRKTNNLVGNGNTATYPFAFKVFTDADVVVKKLEVSTSIETTLTLGANNDYIVTLNEDQNGNPGGSITLKSGGNNQNLANGFQLVITSALEPLQGTDLTNQGGFYPEVINDALDKAVILHQQQQEKLDRSISFSLTNTIGSLEITENANNRKNKVLGFDNLGEFEVLKELGTYRGNWAASTSYAVRDLVKDTSTNNIFFCNTAHTSSGSQPLTTNTNSANWDLIVDAASATTAQNNAASSATASANSATASANSATAAATSETNAATSETNANTHKNDAQTAKTAAETAQTAAETAKTAAETALDSFDDRYLGAKSSNPTLDNDGNALLDGALYFNTTSNIMRVYDLGNTTWLDLNITGTNLTNVNTVAGAIANVNNVGGSIANVNTVGGDIANVNTVATNISNVNTVASDIAKVVTAANDLNEATSEIDTVANAITNVDNVGNNIANVNTVAGISTEVSAVAGNASNVNAVGGAITNVNNVGGSIANVNTVASNISGVNSFAERYRTDNSGNNPSTDLDGGDLFYNQASGKLLVYNAVTSAWEETQSIGNFFINTIGQFSGTGGNSATFNGAAYKFTLSNAGQFAQQMLVSINGVIQKPNSGTGQPSEGFALDGANIVFSSAPPNGADYFIVTIGASVSIGTPSNNTVTSAMIVNGSIVNDDINASAAIAGTKISPDFGSQAITTTNQLTCHNILTIGGTEPRLVFTDADNNPDFTLWANNGLFQIYDTTNSATRLRVNTDGHVDIDGNLDVGAGLDVTGNITVTGTVDGVDIASLNNTVGALGIASGAINSATTAVTQSASDNSTKVATTAFVQTALGNASSDLVDDTSPQLGGDLQSNGHDAKFANNDKAIFGTGNDAAIYHNDTDFHIDAQDSGATRNIYMTCGSVSEGGFFVRSDAGDTMFKALTDSSCFLYFDNDLKFRTMTDHCEIRGHLLPDTNNTDDIGSSSKRFRNIYTNDLNLSNEGGANDVDSTWGSFTIQEGAEDLFLINQRNGKKYKFNLTEVG